MSKLWDTKTAINAAGTKIAQTALKKLGFILVSPVLGVLSNFNPWASSPIANERLLIRGDVENIARGILPNKNMSPLTQQQIDGAKLWLLNHDYPLPPGVEPPQCWQSDTQFADAGTQQVKSGPDRSGAPVGNSLQPPPKEGQRDELNVPAVDSPNRFVRQEDGGGATLLHQLRDRLQQQNPQAGQDDGGGATLLHQLHERLHQQNSLTGVNRVGLGGLGGSLQPPGGSPGGLGGLGGSLQPPGGSPGGLGGLGGSLQPPGGSPGGLGGLGSSLQPPGGSPGGLGGLGNSLQPSLNQLQLLGQNLSPGGWSGGQGGRGPGGSNR